MQHLTFVVLEVCLATRGRAIHCGTDLPTSALQRFRPELGDQQTVSGRAREDRT
jgi:hypothetical protein